MSSDPLVDKVAGLPAELTGALDAIRKTVEPLLGHVIDLFPYYTRHDLVHCDSVIDMAGKIVGQDTCNSLSNAEVFLLVASCYLHDIGMAVSPIGLVWRRWLDVAMKSNGLTAHENLEEDLGSAEMVERFLDEKAALWERFEVFETGYVKGQALEVGLEKVEREFIFGEFIRTYHPEFSASWINENLSDPSGWPGMVAYSAEICKSHGERGLEDEGRFPVESPMHHGNANILYIAAVLRLADLLDMSGSRAPEVLFRALRPDNPKSVQEWQRHMAVRGVIESTAEPGVFNVGVTVPKIM